jgi:hypothetical protein
LNNGALTLKAGSKVYVPNGFKADGTTPKFDEIIIQNDITVVDSWGTNGEIWLFLYSTGDKIKQVRSERVSSGTTPPSATNNQVWYDTATNQIKGYNNASFTSITYSLPIAIGNKTDGVESSILASIDQVFNGFGYIGSTIFVLPGVKGLIPNGRNADGTLRNIEFIADKVSTITYAAVGNELVVSINSNGAMGTASNLIISETKPSGEYILWYKPSENLIRYKSTGDFGVAGTKTLPFCVFSSIATRITSFQPKTTFHALDWNDKSTISGWGMPSNRYIDLTLGASGSTYTAPANGWFSLRKTSSASSRQYMSFYRGDSNLTNETYVTGAVIGSIFPCAKGETVSVYYTLGGTTNNFRFIYAEGEQ